MFAALGFAEESGIPYGMGLVRNHYVGRTFIEPKQSIRHFGVKVKLNAVRSVVGRQARRPRGRLDRARDDVEEARPDAEGRRRERGPHADLVAADANPCHYGIDTPRRKELIASTHDLEEIGQFIEADSLGYLSLEGMLTAFGHGDNETCSACFSGRYPVPLTRARPAGHALSRRTSRRGRRRRPRLRSAARRSAALRPCRSGRTLSTSRPTATARASACASRRAPRARASSASHGGALKLSVKAPPERGKANREVLALVAEAFGLAPSDVELVSGETSPDKVVRLPLSRGGRGAALGGGIAAV